MADNHIYACFLRSQNSENDQANDNGPNSGLKSDFDVEAEKWRLADVLRSVLPFRACHFNEIFFSAWNIFASGKTRDTIASAWKKTGLFPLSLETACNRDGATSTGIWNNTHAANELMGIVIPGAPAPYIVQEGQVLAPAVSLSCAENGTLVGMFSQTQASRGVPLQAHAGGDRVIRAGVCAVLTSQAKSATEVQEAVRVMKAAKRVSIDRQPNGVKFGRNNNPDTIGGKAYTPAVGLAMRMNIARVEQEQEAAAAKQAAAAALKASKVAEAHAEAAIVRAALERRDMNSIEALKAAPVIAAANLILLPSQTFKSKGAAIHALRAKCAPPPASAALASNFGD